MEEEIDQEEICRYCSDRFYDGAANTSPHYLCEGNRCEQAREEYLEDISEDWEDEYELPSQKLFKESNDYIPLPKIGELISKNMI